MSVKVWEEVEWKNVIASLRPAPPPKRPPAPFLAWMKENSHSHNYDELVICMKGSHLAGTNRRAVRLSPGAALFLPRRESHDKGYGPHHRPCVDFWMHFLAPGQVNMNFIVHRPGARLESLPVSAPEGELRRDLSRLATLAAESGGDAEAGVPMRFYLLYFLAALFRRLAQTDFSPTIQAESAIIQGIKRYVSENLVESLTLQDLAKAAGYSPFHFHRMFVRAEGVTPRDFVETRRLERAVALLRQGHSITAAALDAGFSTPSQFSRVFRKHHHLPPSKWLAGGGN